jgi:hypothetical protein
MQTDRRFSRKGLTKKTPLRSARWKFVRRSRSEMTDDICGDHNSLQNQSKRKTETGEQQTADETTFG